MELQSELIFMVWSMKLLISNQGNLNTTAIDHFGHMWKLHLSCLGLPQMNFDYQRNGDEEEG